MITTLHRLQRRAATLILVATVVVTFGLTATPAGAQDDAGGQGFTGVPLTVDDEPVEGVRIVVTDDAGTEIAEAFSGPDGRWTADVPSPGTYTVTLDVESLPDGVDAPAETERTIAVTSGRRRPVNFPLGDAPTIDTPNTAEKIAQASLNGVKQGLIIAMCAVGLSLIFGTTGLINFAHGELVTVGAVVAWGLNAGAGWHLLIAAPAAVVITAIGGGLLERGMLRPLRRRQLGSFQFVVLTIGLSLVVRHIAFLWFGGDGEFYRDYTIQSEWSWGPWSITPRDLTIMLLSIAALVAVAVVLQRTRMGKAMRAVSDNPDLAASSGIDVDGVILTVWIIGAGLAALGGVFLGSVVNVDWLMGFQLLLLMFAAVVLGGLGTAYGAMVGGVVIGLATELSTIWFNPEIKSVFALGVLIVVLLVRPQGILGVKERIG
ncbi:MAG: branched-chain amino acid ABC transporter permease [Acidimicrobiales bacterium]|nr:branched-chain amino acid ABC transporter permease [Acidimicrobiales bacterium]